LHAFGPNGDCRKTNGCLKKAGVQVILAMAEQVNWPEILAADRVRRDMLSGSANITPLCFEHLYTLQKTLTYLPFVCADRLAVGSAN
jgi:hypothetical protein